MDSSIWEHIDLANVILTAIFGILFPALCVGAWRVSVRTRELTKEEEAQNEKIEEIQANCAARASYMERVVATETRLQVYREEMERFMQESREFWRHIDSRLDDVTAHFDATTQSLRNELVNQIQHVNGKVKP